LGERSWYQKHKKENEFILNRGVLRKSENSNLILNGATMDLSVMKPFTESLRSKSYSPLRANQLIQIDSEKPGEMPKEYQVLIGNRKWIKERNFIEIPDDLESRLILQEEQGHTAILAAIDGNNLKNMPISLILTFWIPGVLTAVFGIADTVKPEARLTVYTLKKKNLDVILVILNL